jgi:hypothetical protein
MKKLNENEPIITTKYYTIDMLKDGTYIKVETDEDIKDKIFKTFDEVLSLYSLYGDSRESSETIHAILQTLEMNDIPFQYNSRTRILTLKDRVYYINDVCKNVVDFYNSVLR